MSKLIQNYPLSNELKRITKKVKRFEEMHVALWHLWNMSKAYMDSVNGKADEYVPEDIYKDNLRDALKKARRFIPK